MDIEEDKWENGTQCSEGNEDNLYVDNKFVSFTQLPSYQSDSDDEKNESKNDNYNVKNDNDQDAKNDTNDDLFLTDKPDISDGLFGRNYTEHDPNTITNNNTNNNNTLNKSTIKNVSFEINDESTTDSHSLDNINNTADKQHGLIKDDDDVNNIDKVDQNLNNSNNDNDDNSDDDSYWPINNTESNNNNNDIRLPNLCITQSQPPPPPLPYASKDRDRPVLLDLSLEIEGVITQDISMTTAAADEEGEEYMMDSGEFVLPNLCISQTQQSVLPQPTTHVAPTSAPIKLHDADVKDNHTAEALLPSVPQDKEDHDSSCDAEEDEEQGHVYPNLAITQTQPPPSTPLLTMSSLDIDPQDDGGEVTQAPASQLKHQGDQASFLPPPPLPGALMTSKDLPAVKQQGLTESEVLLKEGVIDQGPTQDSGLIFMFTCDPAAPVPVTSHLPEPQLHAATTTINDDHHHHSSDTGTAVAIESAAHPLDALPSTQPWLAPKNLSTTQGNAVTIADHTPPLPLLPHPPAVTTSALIVSTSTSKVDEERERLKGEYMQTILDNYRKLLAIDASAAVALLSIIKSDTILTLPTTTTTAGADKGNARANGNYGELSQGGSSAVSGLLRLGHQHSDTTEATAEDEVMMIEDDGDDWLPPLANHSDTHSLPPSSTSTSLPTRLFQTTATVAGSTRPLQPTSDWDDDGSDELFKVLEGRKRLKRKITDRQGPSPIKTTTTSATTAAVRKADVYEVEDEIWDTKVDGGGVKDSTVTGVGAVTAAAADKQVKFTDLNISTLSYKQSLTSPTLTTTSATIHNKNTATTKPLQHPHQEEGEGPEEDDTDEHDIPLSLTAADLRTLKFANIWRMLRSHSWSHRKGSGLVDYYYLRPGREQMSTGMMKVGVDCFTSEEELLAFVTQIVLARTGGTGEETAVNTSAAKPTGAPLVVGSKSPPARGLSPVKSGPQNASPVPVPTTAATIPALPWQDRVMSMRWGDLWSVLLGQGWSWDYARGKDALTDMWYIRPGMVSATAVAGLDKFGSRDDVRRYLRRLHQPFYKPTVESQENHTTDLKLAAGAWELARDRRKRKGAPRSDGDGDEAEEERGGEGQIIERKRGRPAKTASVASADSGRSSSKASIQQPTSTNKKHTPTTHAPPVTATSKHRTTATSTKRTAQARAPAQVSSSSDDSYSGEMVIGDNDVFAWDSGLRGLVLDQAVATQRQVCAFIPILKVLI